MVKTKKVEEKKEIKEDNRPAHNPYIVCNDPKCIYCEKDREDQKREEEEAQRRDKEYEQEMEDAKPHCCGQVMREVCEIPDSFEHYFELWQCQGKCKQVRKDHAVYTGMKHPSLKQET